MVVASSLLALSALASTPTLAQDFRRGYFRGHAPVVRYVAPIRYLPRYYVAPYYAYPVAVAPVYRAPVYSYAPSVVYPQTSQYLAPSAIAYPLPQSAAVVVPQIQAPSQSAALPAPQGERAPGERFYCESSRAYYPEVMNCADGWRRVSTPSMPG